MLSNQPIVLNPVSVHALASFNPSADLVWETELSKARDIIVTHPFIGSLVKMDGVDLDSASALERAAKRFGVEAGGGRDLYEKVQSNLATLVRHRARFAGVEEFVTDALETGPLSPIEKMAIAETLLSQLQRRRPSDDTADNDNRLPRQSYAKRHVTVSLAVAAIGALGGIKIGDNEAAMSAYFSDLLNLFARLYIDYNGFPISRDNYDQFPDPEMTKEAVLGGWAEIVRSNPKDACDVFLRGGLLCFLNTCYSNNSGWLRSDAPGELLRAAIRTGKISDDGLRAILNGLNIWRRSYIEEGQAGFSLLADVETLRADALKNMKAADSHLNDVYAPEIFALAADKDRRVSWVGFEALALVFDKLSQNRRREAIGFFLGALMIYKDGDRRFQVAGESLVCEGRLTIEELAHARKEIEGLVAACDDDQYLRKYKLERLLENIRHSAAPEDSTQD